MAIKRLISAVLALSILLSFSAISGFASNSSLPKGNGDNISEDESLEEQFLDMIENCSSKEQRRIILSKAYSFGLTEDDFQSVNLSNDEKAILRGEITVPNASGVGRTIIQPNVSSVKSANSTNSTVAGVEMPDYALWPPIYKQETSTYCSAATVYTVGKFIGANPPSQSSIMAFWQSYWNVTYPDLPLMRNYLNNHLPGKTSDYVNYAVVTYAGNQTTFNTKLKQNVLNYQPMIILMKNNTTSTTNWPYKTNGHFCICSGLLTWESNKYFIGDPYYFLDYVSSATADNGEHKESWGKLNTVITNVFSSGSQKILT
jgi:hypothetical protein